MRRISFCAGHRLLGHEGKCANLHGHNYVAEIYISGNEVDEVGRVVDFAIINQLFKGWIDDNWDHGMILANDDTNAINAMALVEPNKVFPLPYNPTAENMARYMLTEVGPKLLASVEGYELQLTKVVIWETEKSSATAELGSAANTSSSWNNSNAESA
jgi:6-pyruvoyltetrahydropterin/6-carboxytetrahydropterin synthase